MHSCLSDLCQRSIFPVKGGVKIDQWGGGKVDQGRCRRSGIVGEGGVWGGGVGGGGGGRGVLVGRGASWGGPGAPERGGGFGRGGKPPPPPRQVRRRGLAGGSR